MAEKKAFPTQAADYDLLEEIGHGAFAVVYRGICKPLNQVVAIKCMDLDSCNSNLKNVSQEVQLMSLVDHPNIIKAYCSFIVDHFLWVIMPYMDGGSCLHILKIRYPEGLEESVIAVIMKETLKGLDYLHRQQQIHRDVKAGNILTDASGAVKLGDFGTSACMFSSGDRARCRNTLTGTPCWMAPEVMEQKLGYDCSADIWSFGITALELAHGHAPFSKYPPQKVLIMTISSAAPCLEREKDKQFSKAFKDVIKLCLNKDPRRRPTTEKLLKHPFFKHTKFNSSLVQRLLNGLGPLWEREKVLRDKDAALLALRRPAFLQEEERSRNEYKRGVSCWNFDVESLKDQAAMVHDEDEISSTVVGNGASENSFEKECEEIPFGKNNRQPLTLDANQFGRRSSEKELKQFGRFGVFDGDMELESPGWHIVKPQASYDEVSKLPTIAEDKGRNGSMERGLEDSAASRSHSLINALPNGKSLKRDSDNGSIEEALHEISHLSTEKGDSNCVGGSSFPVELDASRNPEVPGFASAGIESLEEKQKEIKCCSKDIGLIQVPPHLELSKIDALSIPAALLRPQLKNLLLQTAKHYETLAYLLKIVSPDEAENVPHFVEHHKTLAGESEAVDFSSNPDSNLEYQVHELQRKVTSLTQELVSFKYRNMQLEHQLNAIYNRQEEEKIQREEAERD